VQTNATISPDTDTPSLVSLAQRGNEAATIALVERFRPLARKIAGLRRGLSLEFEDAESLCIQAFLTTLRSFEPDRSDLLSFWANKANNAISDFYRATSMVSRRNLDLVKAYRSELAECRAKRASAMIYAESFAERHGIKRKRALAVALTAEPAVSMDSGLSSESGATLADIVADESLSPRDLAEGNDATAFAHAQLDALSPTERYVVERYYGLNGHEEETFELIARRIGVTMQRTQQIHVQALHRMRRSASSLDRAS
jgi:RNA polymerase sigma factor (sigma-70 family)